MKELDDLLSKIDKLSDKEKKEALKEIKEAVKEIEKKMQDKKTSNYIDITVENYATTLDALKVVRDSAYEEFKNNNDYISVHTLYKYICKHKKDVANARCKYEKLLATSSRMPDAAVWFEDIDLENKSIKICFNELGYSWFKIQERDGEIIILDSGNKVYGFDDMIKYNYSNFKSLLNDADKFINLFPPDFPLGSLKLYSVNSPFRIEISSSFCFNLFLQNEEIMYFYINRKDIYIMTKSKSAFNFLYYYKFDVLDNIYISVSDLPVEWQEEINRIRDKKNNSKKCLLNTLFGFKK